MSPRSKAAAFIKAASREARVAKASSAREAIGRIGKGTDTFILTFGQFSLIDALIEILEQSGPATVDLCTWTAADAHLRRSRELVEEASITRFRMIVDRSFETRQPGYCFHMRRLFGEDCIRAIRAHSKFMVVRSPTLDVVVRTSMNLNENPRLENLEISESRAFAEFFESLVSEIFREVEPGENRSALLDLAEIPDSYPFREVEAGHISRGSLCEVETTHTLKKL